LGLASGLEALLLNKVSHYDIQCNTDVTGFLLLFPNDTGKVEF
jgi:hypothetical protein